MKFTEILNEGLYADLFADRIAEKQFALRKEHLDFLLENLELLPGISEVKLDQQTQESIGHGTRSRLTDSFQYCGFVGVFKDVEVKFELSISGYSIGATLKKDGNTEYTPQCKTFKTLVSGLEKAYKKLSK